MPNSRFYSSIAAVTNLQSTIAPGDNSIQLASSSGFPSSFPFTLALDYGAANEELVDVTAGGPTIFSVTRAVDGTSSSTHNAGAVVRHVSSARDFTDSRTHEASTTGIHGVTGAIVGTTQVQTLTNKTLTSPTINSGALSGTFSGTPTFSGNTTFSGGATIAGGALSGTFSGSPTLSGTVNHTGTIQSTQSASGNVSLATIVTGDTFDRLRTYASGTLEWGSGAAARDTNLFRDSANMLRTNDNLTVDGSTITNTLTVSNTATINSLNVTNLTPGSTDLSSGAFLIASSGWSVSALSAGVLKAGFVTLNINFQRTGGNITVDSLGNLSTGIVQMGTINAVYAPDSTLGTMYVHAGNTSGTGIARITASTGAVELVRFQANQTIATGNIMSITVTYPIA